MENNDELSSEPLEFRLSFVPSSITVISINENYASTIFYPFVQDLNDTEQGSSEKESICSNEVLGNPEGSESVLCRKEVEYLSKKVDECANYVTSYASKWNEKVKDSTNVSRCFAKRRCCALDCKNTDISSKLYSFPSVFDKNARGSKVNNITKLTRCREWVKNSGNINILELDPATLNNKYFLCREHFSQSNMTSKMSTSLKRNAVPTLFSSSSISDAMMTVYDLRWNIPSESLLLEQCVRILENTTENEAVTEDACAALRDDLGDKDSTVLDTTENKNILENGCAASRDSFGNEECTVLDCNETLNANELHDAFVKKENKSPRKKCCFLKCVGQGSRRMFSFPNILLRKNKIQEIDPDRLERCLTWLKHSANEDLLKISPLNLHNVAHVCASHFQDCHFTSTMMTNLKNTAIPTTLSPHSEESMLKYQKCFEWLPGSTLEECSSSWNDIENALRFENDMHMLEWYVCLTCKETQLKTRKGMLQCIHRKLCKSHFSHENNMDPGPVPGLVALKNLGVCPHKYFSSEVDESCLKVQRFNFGETIVQLGSVLNLSYNVLQSLGPIDIIWGGSPCSDLSNVNPNKKGLHGGTGILFFEFVKIMLYFKNLAVMERREDRFFWLYENTAGMEKKTKDEISRELRCEPIEICSSSFVPMRRKRLFWTNIPITQEYLSQLESRAYLKRELQEVLKGSGREANISILPTVTSNPNNLIKGGVHPVTDAHDGPGHLYYSEIEKLYGLPEHFTAGPNTTLLSRKRLLSKAWDVHTIEFLIKPLIEKMAL